jgi:hypothetical protein
MTNPILRYPVNGLVSYHYYRNRNIDEMASWGFRLIGDSGAFSAMSLGQPIQMDEFAAWGHKWKDSLCWIASLDVIGDEKGSWQNYKALKGMGLDVIPTIHFGQDPKVLDQYAADGVDYVGLGGMVSQRSQEKKLLRWCLSVFRYAKENHPNMRFHGWGVTHPELILNLPFYSVDSSGFGSTWRYARTRLWDPEKKRFVRFRHDGKEPYEYRQLLHDWYDGVTPEEIEFSTPENKRVLVLLAIKNAQLLEDYLRDRFQVEPPKYGLREPLIGPNIHQVDTAFSYWQQAAKPEAGFIHEGKGTRLADKGPNVHIATTATNFYKDAKGPNIHFVDSDVQNFEAVDQNGPQVHMVWSKDGDQLIKSVGPNIHPVVDYSDYKLSGRPLKN